MYVGECSVKYTVGDKQYSVWLASGYLDQDPKFIEDKMQACRVSRYAIHYNPQNAADSFNGAVPMMSNLHRLPISAVRI